MTIVDFLTKAKDFLVVQATQSSISECHNHRERVERYIERYSYLSEEGLIKKLRDGNSEQSYACKYLLSQMYAGNSDDSDE